MTHAAGTVTLFGGPCDGEIRAVQGDRDEFHVDQYLGLEQDGVITKRYVYRRSGRRDVFTFVGEVL